NNSQREYATYNKCSERLKNKWQEKKSNISKNQKISQSSSNITDTSSVNSNLQIIKSINFADNFLEVMPYESFNTKDNNQENKDKNSKDNNNSKILLYDLDEVCEITSKIFEDAKESNKLVKFIFEVELDEDLINTITLTQQDLVNTNDLKIIKGRFNQLAKILIIPLDSGSGYYWEIRKIWLKSHKKKFIGSATVYLSCTMQDDRAWIKPNNQIPKQHSEVRVPINRYNCAEKIKLTIVLDNKYVLVQENHKIAHENPIYRQVVFPISAKE
ncbi:693_t:CDS:2, partial [Cetraspora pellucida]